MDYDDERPDWAEDNDRWKRYNGVANRAHRLGYGNLSAGWTLKPRPHGQFRIAKVGDGQRAIIVTGNTPMDAVEEMDWLLDRIEAAQP